MGSTGTGRFGDYVSKGKTPDENPRGNNTTGTDSGFTDLCDKSLKNVKLDDVSQSEFYLNHNSLPAINHTVQIRKKLYNKRIVVETADTNEILGNLPTNYNYIISCLEFGKRYEGTVISSTNIPYPQVVVNMHAF